MENGFFTFQMEKLKQKENSEMVMRVGKWRYYYESGKIKQISSYSKLGERQGKWIEYDEDGKKSKTTIYKLDLTLA